MSSDQTPVTVACVDVQCPECGFEFQLPVADALGPLIESEVVRRMTVSRNELAEAIREMANREADERNRVALFARDKTISDLRVQVDDLRRKIDAGGAIAAGEVQESRLEAALKAAFGTDRISPVEHGVTGADIIQEVITTSGGVAGKILWESKLTKNWNPDWLPKLRKDMRDVDAAIAVIATVAMPKNVELFERVDDVFVVAYRHAIPMARVLRQVLIDIAIIRACNKTEDGVADKLLTYLSSTKFRSRVMTVIEATMMMQSDLEAEKRSAARKWARSQANIESVVTGMAAMYGDMQGVVGKNLLVTVPGLLTAGEADMG